MTSNNSNNVNNANGGESGNGADGAIEGVAIEAAANFTGSEQRQAAVNDAAVADGSVTNGSAGGWGVEPGSAAGRADGGRAAADNGGTASMRGIVRLVWEMPNGLPGPGLLDAEPPDTARPGYRLAAAPGSSGYAPNGPMPGSYGEGSRAAWYAQNAPTQAMNPQPGKYASGEWPEHERAGRDGARREYTRCERAGRPDAVVCGLEQPGPMPWSNGRSGPDTERLEGRRTRVER